MADGPDEELIDPSPPPAETPRNWRVGRLVFYGLLLLWAGGQLTSTNTGFLFAALASIPLAMIGFGWLLFRLNGIYERTRGDAPGGSTRNPLLVSLSDERAGLRRAKAPRRLIDVAMTGSAITAMVLLVVWFFFLAEMDLAPLGQ